MAPFGAPIGGWINGNAASAVHDFSRMPAAGFNAVVQVHAKHVSPTGTTALVALEYNFRGATVHTTTIASVTGPCGWTHALGHL